MVPMLLLSHSQDCNFTGYLAVLGLCFGSVLKKREVLERSDRDVSCDLVCDEESYYDTSSICGDDGVLYSK